jgi:hypothetical protein
MALSGDASEGYAVSGFSSGYPIQGWLRPICNPLKYQCSIKQYGVIGWYPAVTDCRQAVQWFLLRDTADGTEIIGSMNKSVCDQVPDACYPNLNQ